MKSEMTSMISPILFRLKKIVIPIRHRDKNLLPYAPSQNTTTIHLQFNWETNITPNAIAIVAARKATNASEVETDDLHHYPTDCGLKGHPLTKK